MLKQWLEVFKYGCHKFDTSDPTEMGLIESCIELWNSTSVGTCYMTHLGTS